MGLYYLEAFGDGVFIPGVIYCKKETQHNQIQWWPGGRPAWGVRRAPAGGAMLRALAASTEPRRGPTPELRQRRSLGGHAQKQKNQELQSGIRQNHTLFEKCRMKMTWILPENPKPWISVRDIYKYRPHSCSERVWALDLVVLGESKTHLENRAKCKASPTNSYFSQKHTTLFILFCINYYIWPPINKMKI